MKARSAVVGSGVTAAAAVLGNVFVGKEALSWFRGLRAPRFQLPMPGFVSVAAANYVIMAVVLARGIDRRDAGAIAWAVAVLAGNVESYLEMMNSNRQFLHRDGALTAAECCSRSTDQLAPTMERIGSSETT